MTTLRWWWRWLVAQLYAPEPELRGLRLTQGGVLQRARLGQMVVASHDRRGLSRNAIRTRIVWHIRADSPATAADLLYDLDCPPIEGQPHTGNW